ncbi:CBS domain-containing protein [Ornithinibacillus halophilus]|uniref:CBS domain-containing protein n=1 Tax=Ornithinibacillus halophilus TaxID=930117 RepID=A0A1M5HSE7_9BACI|nr:CBS domain-containing protein [Ornithinibacillus halophilus]SHG18866.1 CBS domain-containing protein [Ornithinibacillus halophilus]
MERNSERFLTAFNRIEKALRQEMRNSKGIGFSKAVKIMSKHNLNLNRYAEDLLEYAELRNAIVHNRIDTDFAIAEPHNSIVEQIEKIEKSITQPQQVVPVFERKVISFQEDDSLEKVLDTIEQRGFSKFPIYHDNEFRGLISESGITKWLASSKFKSGIDTKIKDILPFQKDGNYQFINNDTPVIEAVEIFKAQIEKGNRVDALLITKYGSSKEPLLGIITSWDIIAVE